MNFPFMPVHLLHLRSFKAAACLLTCKKHLTSILKCCPRELTASQFLANSDFFTYKRDVSTSLPFSKFHEALEWAWFGHPQVFKIYYESFTEITLHTTRSALSSGHLSKEQAASNFAHPFANYSAREI
jgi:hypothetical protein